LPESETQQNQRFVRVESAATMPKERRAGKAKHNRTNPTGLPSIAEALAGVVEHPDEIESGLEENVPVFQKVSKAICKLCKFNY
jgi:hypothetical protein